MNDQNYSNLEFEEIASYNTQGGQFTTTILTAEIRTNYKAVVWRTKDNASGQVTETVTIDSTYTAFLDNVHRVPPNYGNTQPDQPVTSRETGLTPN